MKILILLAALLTGCVTQQQQNEEMRADWNSYIAEYKPKAVAGEIPWSNYFVGLHTRAIRAKAPSSFITQLEYMMKVAEKYEAGLIDKATFEREREQTKQGTARMIGADIAASQQQDARGAASINAANQLIQAGKPQTYSPPVSPSTGIIGFLKGQNMSGNLRYCYYSNGVIKTIAAIELCPINTN